MTRALRAAWTATVLGAVLCLLAVPVAAQPYPPAPPTEPPPAEVEVRCEVDDEPALTCEGEGYLPGSQVTIEVRHADTVVAEVEVEVEADGTFRVRHPLPCRVGDSSVDVTVTGRDGQDQRTVETRTLEVPPTPDCDPSAPDPGGFADDDVQGGVDTDDDGSLAFTGRNLLVLLAIALLVLAAGTVLVRARRRGEGPA